MNTYEVKLKYTTEIEMEVDANEEEEAVKIANLTAKMYPTDRDVIKNLRLTKSRCKKIRTIIFPIR